MNIEEILRLSVQKGASDVHLKAGIMPVIRKHGALRPLAANLPVLSGETIESIAFGLMTPMQQQKFNELQELDLGYGISGLGRFRINVFRQRGTIRLVIRNIPHAVPNVEQLCLPESLHKIASQERGLILVTGITGSGKSSTLAAMIDHINRTQNKHILTIEDPIEFLIRDRKSILTQRELGVDATSYSTALRAALRQDPDVILIGEMRDRETTEIALLAAETGHLVFSTLHTLDATESINRIVASFEPHHQHQVRLQLASVLRAVISQRLTRRKDNKGFVPAVEVMINTPRIRELIEDKDQSKSISTAIEEGRSAWGMQSFDQSLMQLVTKGIISLEEALRASSSPEDFKIRYSGINATEEDRWDQNDTHRARVEKAWDKLSEVEIETPTEIKKNEKLARKKSS